MLLTVVRVYQQGRKLSEAELRAAVTGCWRRAYPDRADQRESDTPGLLHGRQQGILPPLIAPQLTGISPLALGLEGYEEAQTAEGIVFYR
jgi:hypothetical protein